ncbi:MAG: sigma-70 family RNA polymerase sigma factor [Planctomycetota bacterium]
MSDVPHDSGGEADGSAAEDQLRSTWSIGPLRPWMMMLAERQLSGRLKGQLDASDIVQQALLDAWQGRDGFQGTTHVERLAWLRVILTRVIMRRDRELFQTQKRGEGREKLLQAAIDRSSLCLEKLAVSNEPDPGLAADRAEQSLQLAATLSELPDDYRMVLTFRHLEDLSHAEIAERMERSVPAVRMLWIRALEALKSASSDRLG